MPSAQRTLSDEEDCCSIATVKRSNVSKKEEHAGIIAAALLALPKDKLIVFLDLIPIIESGKDLAKILAKFLKSSRQQGRGQEKRTVSELHIKQIQSTLFNMMNDSASQRDAHWEKKLREMADALGKEPSLRDKRTGLADQQSKRKKRSKHVKFLLPNASWKIHTEKE